MNELLQTERTYVADLKCVIEVRVFAFFCKKIYYSSACKIVKIATVNISCDLTDLGNFPALMWAFASSLFQLISHLIIPFVVAAVIKT